jgi:vacuolar protein-sorting-associated protein 4
MQGVGNTGQGNVLVLGATNMPWGLDHAMIRRFEKRIYIDLPDKPDRIELIKTKLKNNLHQLSVGEYADIANRTKNYSGADLEILCKDAAMERVRFAQFAKKFQKEIIEGVVRYTAVEASAKGHSINAMTFYDLPERSLKLDAIGYSDFICALKRTKATVSPGDLTAFEDWTEEFGVAGK